MSVFPTSINTQSPSTRLWSGLKHRSQKVFSKEGRNEMEGCKNMLVQGGEGKKRKGRVDLYVLLLACLDS